MVIKTHSFEYNDINNLPPRTSFAQDHWGFYNGQNNQGLTPKPASLFTAARFPAATANRDPKGDYAKKGVLQKITYPTGGYQEFELESNTVNRAVQVPPPLTSVNLQGQGDASGCTSFVKQFTAPSNQEVSLRGQADPASASYDPIHAKAIVTLNDVTGSIVIYRGTIKAGQNINEIVSLIANHIYTLTLDACWGIQAATTLDYYATAPLTQIVNQMVGGIRVKSISSAAGFNQPVMKNCFAYAALSDLSKSSGKSSVNFRYENISMTRTWCVFGVRDVECMFNVMYSNSLYNNSVYAGNIIQYEYVTVMDGGFDHPLGAVEHKFSVSEDIAATPLLSEELIGAPKSNYSLYGGRELEQTVYNSQLQKVRRTVTEYKDDQTAARTIKAYAVAQIVTPPGAQSTLIPMEDQINSYACSAYEILSRWIYKSKETTYEYRSGIIAMQNQVEYDYANSLHCLPTKITTFNSKQEKQVIELKYSTESVSVTSMDPLLLPFKYDVLFTACENNYYNAITPLNTQINNLFSQQMGIFATCQAYIIGNCSICPVTMACGSTNCQGYQLVKAKECCYNHPDYILYQADIDNLTGVVKPQYHSAYLTCLNNNASAYLSDVTAFNNELDNQISIANDLNTKALYTLRKKGIVELVEKKEYVINENGTTVLGTTVQNNFKQIANGDIVPDNVFVAKNGSVSVKQVSFNGYDATGNILEYQSKDGIDASIIWDYTRKYPIAKVAGAKQDQCAATSFESDGKGNWQFTGTTVEGTLFKGITGNRYFDLNAGSITKTNLPAANYVVSLWKRSAGSVSVNGNTVPAITGRTIKGWTYVEFNVNTTNVSITGTASIDELRLYPVGAQMSTLTYIPVIGAASECDPNNKIIYYEYDSAGRLRRVKDQDGNIIKAFDYQYQVNQ